MIEKYGVTFADGATEAAIELWMSFDINQGGVSLHQAEGFLGAFNHLQRAIDIIWNSNGRNMLIWNEWTELMMRSFIENREIPVSGPSASWKSTCAACYGVAFWMADPLRTKVIVSSTSLGGLRERIWKDILGFYRASKCGFGNVINHPNPKIQTIKADDSTGLHGIAVEQGDVNKAIDKIKGRHAPRVLVEIDEATGAQSAIVDVTMNLETGCERFQLIPIANPSSYFDEHGKLSEPENGWNSITVDSTTWKTKRGGLAVHLDGLKSPNVLAGYKKYPGMISQDDIDIAAKRDGEFSPRFWQERRGFWPPEGITKTVLTEAIIVKFHARDKPVWVGSKVKIAALDVAFEGGDQKPLGFINVGKIDDNGTIHTVMCFDEVLYLKVDITSKEPIHYQITRQVREECKSRGVEPYYFGMDTTGEGGGTADILKREWSGDFLSVEFGGRASDRRISDINPRKGWEEYANRVSELWYQFRRGVELDQVRGMPIEMATEFCQRNYEVRGHLIIVESKTKMKARIGHSPDVADMGVIAYEVAIDRGLLPFDAAVNPSGRTQQENWMDFAKSISPVSKYAQTT